ncbi:MAG: F0F1 ATP synthase subunit beta, partial [Anaerolineae bacterium]|nr:F0F1 ATP synthase subunit beta [Anaerolineae bacterium]
MGKSGAIGKLVQVIGPVVDVEFKPEELPDIYDALEVQLDDGGRLVCEVQGQLSGGWVRSVAMSSTDGLRRGMPVIATGGPIKVPVGEGTLGRIFNVLGEPIDSPKPVEATDHY